ncbi:MAG: hypothetical protein A4E47_00163 [Methanosaeta sp. PtaU1.Bin028]|nr:MAG: hypothetical protein A4E47_00163 [Methanosaeta sp. PtaU1.Bin028]
MRATSNVAFGISLLIIVFALILPAQAKITSGCGSNWLGGDVIGSATVTPVGVERPNMNVPEPKVTKPDMSMPKPNPQPLKKDSNASNASNETGPAAEEALGQPEDVSFNLSGKWAFSFLDGSGPSAELTIYPAGKMFFGRGTLVKDNSTIPVTAVGSQDSQAIKLDIVQTVDGEKFRQDTLYKMKLSANNQTLQGTYDQMGTEGSAGKIVASGNVTGQRIA